MLYWYEIENRFDQTIGQFYEDNFELRKTTKYQGPKASKPDGEFRSIASFYIGHYKKGNRSEEPELTITSNYETLSFKYNIYKKDTIYPGVIGDDILLKECFGE